VVDWALEAFEGDELIDEAELVVALDVDVSAAITPPLARNITTAEVAPHLRIVRVRRRRADNRAAAS
jgi:hypothetical protein